MVQGEGGGGEQGRKGARITHLFPDSMFGSSLADWTSAHSKKMRSSPAVTPEPENYLCFVVIFAIDIGGRWQAGPRGSQQPAGCAGEHAARMHGVCRWGTWARGRQTRHRMPACCRRSASGKKGQNTDKKLREETEHKPSGEKSSLGGDEPSVAKNSAEGISASCFMAAGSSGVGGT